MPNNKLFVGGLAWATDDSSFRTAFEQFGSVTDAKVITDRDTGRSRGFGFITFENADDAQEAIKQMDGSNLDGRSIRVNEANERPRGRSGGSRGGGDTYHHGGGRDNGDGGSRPPRRPNKKGGGRW
jgi:RNA recognition motif-containing protein